MPESGRHFRFETLQGCRASKLLALAEVHPYNPLTHIMFDESQIKSDS